MSVIKIYKDRAAKRIVLRSEPMILSVKLQKITVSILTHGPI
jgi:hypothetical protein